MPYFFNRLWSIFLYLLIFETLEIINLEKDGFQINTFKKRVKRSVANDMQLNKTFTEINRQYQCQIQLAFLDLSHVNQTFFLQEDVSKLSISALTTNGVVLPGSSANLISLQYNFTGFSPFSLTYKFIPNNMSGTEVRNVTVFGGAMNSLLTESYCLQRANFNDTVRTNSALICCCFLAILIVIIIFIIIWFIFCRHRQSVELQIVEVKKEDGFSMKKYALLLEESQKNTQNGRSLNDPKYFVTILPNNQPQNMEYDLFEMEVATSREADLKIRNDLTKLNDAFFTIWINSISEQFPHTRDKLNQISKQIVTERENIRKKYENVLAERLKSITKEIIAVNNDNLSNLKMTQDAEKSRIMQMIVPEDQVEAEENLNKVFDKETQNLVIQLKVNQEEALEEAKMKCHSDMMNEVTMTQMSFIKPFSSDNLLNSSDVDDVIKRYIQWQEKLQSLSESEKIRQAAAIAYLLENRRNHASGTELQNNATNELLETKMDHFETTITEFEENEEISRNMSSKILTQFENDRQKIIAEMEKSKESQVKSLLDRLQENKRKKLDDLKAKQENELNNLLTSHSSEKTVKDLAQGFSELKVEHCEEFTTLEAEADDENYEALDALFEEIGTQTLEKIDERMEELCSELKREGFSEDDIREIFDDSNRKMERIMKSQQNEKEKQRRQLEERLEKIRREIETNSQKQSKDQANIASVQNDVLNEIMNMQKTLSDDERNRIMEQYSKNKYSIETNIASERLLQKRKIDEMINAKKMKNNKKLSEKLDGDVKDILEGGVKNKKQQKTENTISRCALDFLKEKVNLATQQDSPQTLDQEMAKIRNEIMEERAFLIHKKEEEIAALLNKIQILKATEGVELKEQQDKLVQLQMVALDSIEDKKNVQGIMKKHNQEKDKLNDVIYMNKKQQEEKFMRRKENSGLKSLLGNGSAKPIESQSAEDLQRKKQNQENEMLQNNLKTENDLKQFQVDFFKGLVAAGNFPRSEILELVQKKFPLKTNLEIENIVEELYPKSQEKIKNAQPQRSLIESLKKIDESDKLKNSISRPGSAFSTKSNQRPIVRNEGLRRPDTSTTSYDDMKSKNIKTKKNRKQNSSDEYDEAF